jgi:hypothetical protein
MRPRHWQWLLGDGGGQFRIILWKSVWPLPHVIPYELAGATVYSGQQRCKAWRKCQVGLTLEAETVVDIMHLF